MLDIQSDMAKNIVAFDIDRAVAFQVLLRIFSDSSSTFSMRSTFFQTSTSYVYCRLDSQGDVIAIEAKQVNSS